MLTVSDDEFWQGVLRVEFGELLALQDAVTVLRYPIGGDTISVTSGVVSRMEILSFAYCRWLLQIDAAIKGLNLQLQKLIFCSHLMLFLALMESMLQMMAPVNFFILKNFWVNLFWAEFFRTTTCNEFFRYHRMFSSSRRVIDFELFTSSHFIYEFL